MINPNMQTEPDFKKITIAIIGFGEVGSIFGAALVQAGYTVISYDRQDKSALAATLGVTTAASAAGAVADVQLVISAVTASQTEPVALAVAPHIAKDAFYLDFNSASPSAKQGCAAMINAAGGRYLKCAVMTTVPPYGIKVPMLLGGPHVAAAMDLLTALGFSATNQNVPHGTVSAVNQKSTQP
jgi:3-hydroxyisobutyrate dehydrogenase-like beta-hydroxyacid dehydrogenase